jgi:UDP-N-acetylglucosamine enolpyruvyl transferase
MSVSAARIARREETSPRRAHASAAAGEEELLVHGGLRLAGDVQLSGFKHSLVTVVAAGAAACAPLTIANCPAVLEADVLESILVELGAHVRRTADTIAIDAGPLAGGAVDDAQAGRIHGTAYLAPALLARTGRATISAGGGCQIGDDAGGGRPFRHYVDVLVRFGARVADESTSGVTLTAERLAGAHVDLLDYATHRDLRSGPLYSGATKMALLVAAVAHGTTVLEHPYPKRDVRDLVEVLARLGADVESSTADGRIVVRGRGPEALDRPAEHALVPDLIELVTWICAGTLLAGPSLTLRAPRMQAALHALAAELELLESMGVQLEPAPEQLVVQAVERLAPIRVLVTSGGIYSDSQPFLALLATRAHGASQIAETVWERRFGYASGLRALGVRATEASSQLSIAGPCPPHVAGRRVHAPDLRAAAALLLAALEVDGETTVTGAQHLARGYADMPRALRSLGARVERVGAR